MSVEEIVKSLKDGDNIAAGKAYDSIMAEKLRASLDAKKIELAPSMVGTQPIIPVEEPGEVTQDEINN